MAEPEKVSVCHLTGLVDFGLVLFIPGAVQADVRARIAYQRILLAVIHGDVGQCLQLELVMEVRKIFFWDPYVDAGNRLDVDFGDRNDDWAVGAYTLPKHDYVRIVDHLLVLDNLLILDHLRTLSGVRRGWRQRRLRIRRRRRQWLGWSGGIALSLWSRIRALSRFGSLCRTGIWRCILRSVGCRARRSRVRYLLGRRLAGNGCGFRRGFDRCLNADQRRGGKQRHRHQEHGQQSAAAGGGKRVAETGFVQKALNALGKMTGACHGNSCKGWARQGREFKKDLGVGGAAGGLLKAGAVADGFAQFVKFAFQPPSKRAEPEQRSIEGGGQLQVKVALADVRAFVGQHDAQLLFAPAHVIGRQNDAGADVHRGGNATTCPHANPCILLRERLCRLGRQPQSER